MGSATPDEASGSREILAALEHTLRCRSARIVFRFDAVLTDDAFAPIPRGSRPHGGPLVRRVGRAAVRASDPALRWGMRRVLARVAKPMAQGAGGVVDLAEHRCAYRLPGSSAAELIVGDRRWHAAPGSAVDDGAARAADALQPLWLVDLVRGVVDAREHAPEDLDGRRARRFSAHADLNRAAEAVSHRLAIPSGTAWLDDLERLSVDVWIDDAGHIRRIRHTADGSSGRTTITLDLVELGVELPSDWSRIPACG